MSVHPPEVKFTSAEDLAAGDLNAWDGSLAVERSLVVARNILLVYDGGLGVVVRCVLKVGLYWGGFMNDLGNKISSKVKRV